MKFKTVVLATIGISLAGLLVAQTSQNNSSQSNSKSGNSQASSSSSSRSSASSSGSKSSFSSARGSHSGSGSAFGNSFSGKPTHAILYTLNADAASDANVRLRVINAQNKYLGDLQAKGKVIFCGPWRDLPGSMAIVIAQSDEEATQIAQNDPSVQSENQTFEVRAWQVAQARSQN